MKANQQSLLVVDDDAIQVTFLKSILNESGYDVLHTTNGVEALRLLNDFHPRFSAVITDRYMPNMDGIELIRQIKSHDQLRTLPVIMQTSADSDSDIRAGFQAGAHFYLTKPIAESHLVSVVSSAVSFGERHQNWQKWVPERSHPIELLRSGLFYFKTLHDCQHLASLLANAFPNPKMAVLGLLEIMINAIEHGNLGITYEEKTFLAAQNTWLEEVEHRLSLPLHSQKWASLHFSHEEDRIIIFIRDQGEGFDFDRFKEIDPRRVFDSHGRGIVVARTMSFDEVIYTDNGRSVSCIKNLQVSKD